MEVLGTIQDFHALRGERITVENWCLPSKPLKIYSGENGQGWFEGNGFLVAPNLVLTAGHNLLKDYRNLFDYVWVKDPQTGSLIKPVVSRDSIILEERYFRHGTDVLDYGIIKLPGPIQHIPPFHLARNAVFSNKRCILTGYMLNDPYNSPRVFKLVASRHGSRSRYISSTTILHEGLSGSPLIKDDVVVGIYTGLHARKSKFIPVDRAQGLIARI